ncbi:branched-chain amino acid ABC transporter ATP-binding protein/permease [Bradyrhizobium sp. dw_78]|uniref:branched-chain amino acid ABC transporter ATP-binding protein/permease n=1 Tax=Bradyrhizobium sp. dw_78 TaxID=2719793 RepID=UPI001BD4EF5D|nr:branched-chain amino acid ABC transporter ATP-binding protein/permease [Bradyrhizobium sp. dw_78]
MSGTRVFGLLALPIGLPALFILAGCLADDYWRYVLCLTVSAVVVGAGLTMLVSFARCITLATGAFQALGAYGAVLLMINLSLPFPLAVVAGGCAGALGGLFLAVPAVRFRSHNLAMVTLVFQSIVIIALRELKGLTGGAEGLSVPAATILGVAIRSDLANLVMACVFSALILIPLMILLQGPFGRNLRALAVNEVGARAFGIRIEHYLIAAFVISSAAIAMAAAIVAPRLRIIDPDSFGLYSSILTLAYPIVGGLGSVWGGAVGGAVLRILPEVLRPIAGYIELILSTVVLLTMLCFRGGLSEMVSRLWPARSEPARSSRGSDAVVVSALPHLVQPHDHSAVEALVTDKLVKRYDALTAVDGVNLKVRAGALHGIMGPNGAGKTTLFNTVSGFIRPDAGQIRLFGTDVTSDRIEQRIGLGVTRTFQNLAIFPSLSCRQNVIIGFGRNSIGAALGRSAGWALNTKTSREEAERADWALDAVGLAHVMDLPAGKLSLGDQRRLEIARAVVSQPRLILLDEPVSGVSQQEVEQLLVLLKAINRDLGATMLVVEHNIGFLVSLCDTLSVMASGRIIAEGVPAEVVARRDVLRTYFGETDEAA